MHVSQSSKSTGKKSCGSESSVQLDPSSVLLRTFPNPTPTYNVPAFCASNATAVASFPNEVCVQVDPPSVLSNRPHGLDCAPLERDPPANSMFGFCGSIDKVPLKAPIAASVVPPRVKELQVAPPSVLLKIPPSNGRPFFHAEGRIPS